MRRGGFTLLEVLIALAILAIALAAVSRATSSTVDTSIALKERMLALWVAQNRLAESLAQRRFPSAGTKDGEASQAGELFKWREIVSDTPEPKFRRIEIQVYSPAQADRVAAQLVGYLADQR